MSEGGEELVFSWDKFPRGFAQFVYDEVAENEEGKANPEKLIFTELNSIASVDNSGSTGGSTGETGIIDASRNIVAEFYNGDTSKSIIAWNSSASVIPINQLRPTGGTQPSCMFPLLNGIQTLLVTTDGDFYGVERVIPMVESSSVIHVIAIYVGSRCIQPASLNLPVFAPFMHVPGVFVLCHYDGVLLKLLLKQNCSQLPSYEFEINSNTTWNDFATISVASLLEIKSKINSKSSLPLGVIRLEDKLFKAKEFAEYLTSNEEAIGTEDFEAFMKVVLPFVSNDIKKAGLQNEYMQLLGKWQIIATERAKAAAERFLLVQNESYNLKKQRAEYLHSKLTNGDKSVKAEFGALTKELYAISQDQSKIVKGRVAEVAALYNQAVQEFTQTQTGGSGYSLSELSKKVSSNRARRATQVSSEAIEIINYDLLESFEVEECDVCSEKRTQAVLLLDIGTEQVQMNTSDYALNDALSLGIYNKKAIPASNICIYCADYLLNNSTCPYTREKIVSLLVPVRSTPTNDQLVCAEISKAFFGNAKLGIEFQTILSCLDCLRERFQPGLVDYFEKKILFNSNANLLGPLNGGTSEKFIDSINAVLNYDLDEFYPDSWLTPLRNKSLLTMSIMIRMLLKHTPSDTPKDLYQPILLRTLFKAIVSRVLSFAKHENVNRLKLALEKDLFDVYSTGIPIFGSDKLIRLEDSKVLQLLFKDLGERILPPIQSYCKATSQTLDEFLPPQMLTSILFHAIQYVNVLEKEEPFLTSLVTNHNAFRSAFWGRLNELDNIQKLIAKKYFPDIYFTQFEKIESYRSDPHSQPIQYSPLFLNGGVKLCCAVCGEKFISEDNFNLEAAEIYKIVSTTRSDHIYKGTNVFTKYSNLLRNTLEIIESDPTIVGTTASRKLLLELLKRVKKRNQGDIHQKDLLQRCVSVINDAVTKYNAGIMPTATRHNMIIEIQAEIEYVKKNGWFTPGLASLDGIPEELLPELLAPLSDEELAYLI